MTTYDRIRNLRQSLNMTQSELAELMGYKNNSAIAKIEAGQRDISETLLMKFADVFHVSPAYLMGWTDSVDPVASENELDNLLVEKLTSLSPDEEAKVLAYIEGLIANRQV